MQTRLGRHGTALTDEGRLNLRERPLSRCDDSPLDDVRARARCPRSTPAGYLRHLLPGGRAHGAAPAHPAQPGLDAAARWTGCATAIAAGTFDASAREVLAIWGCLIGAGLTALARRAPDYASLNAPSLEHDSCDPPPLGALVRSSLVILMLMVTYFLLIRPQQQRMRSSRRWSARIEVATR